MNNNKKAATSNLVNKKEEKLVITEFRNDAQKSSSKVQQNNLNNSMSNMILNTNNLINNMNRSLSTNGINHHHHLLQDNNKLITNSNVGKLRISSEMKQKLELLTINQSVRSTIKSSNFNKNDLMAKSMENLQDIRENSNRVNKLSKERKSLLEKQLIGQFTTSKVNSVDNLTSSNQLNASTKLIANNNSEFASEFKNDFKLIKSNAQNYYPRESRERMDELGHKLTKLNQNSSASLGALNFCYDCKKNEESNCKFYCRERLEYEQQTTSTSMCNINDLNNQFNQINNLHKKFVNETLFGENLDSGHFAGMKQQHQNGNHQLHHQQAPANESNLKLNTKLYPPLNKLYLTYQKVPFELRLRKELFSPTERIESPMILNFIFLQIIRDAFSSKCLRMRTDEKQSIIKHLESIGLNKQNYLNTSNKLTVQKTIVQQARQMPLYFSRFYSIINCKNYPDTNQLAVSHSGLRLVRSNSNEIRIIETICFEDIVEIVSIKDNYIQILGKNNTWIHLISDKVSKHC